MKYKREFIVVGTLLSAILLYLFVHILLQKPTIFEASVGAPAMGSYRLAGSISTGAVQRNITYCGNQKLDLYLPRTKQYDKAPLLIFIHGGGWHANNKNSDKNIFALVDGLRDKGFAIASINYRQTPKNQFPAPVEDALCSVRYLRAHANLYNLDESRFAAMGFSAGGQLAAMIGVLPTQNPFNNGPYRDETSQVSAVVTIAGVFDFSKNLKPNSVANIRNLMQGLPPSVGAPVSYVSDDDPPFLLIRGDKDSIGLAAQDTSFANKLKDSGVTYRVITVSNAEHDLSSPSGQQSPSLSEISQTIQAFITAKLGL